MGQTANRIFVKTIDSLVTTGNVGQMGRGTEGTELLARQVCLDMAFPFPTLPERKINYKLLAAGALWHINGENDVVSLQKYSSGIGNYYKGRFAYGAYGPKIRQQLPYIVDSFRIDPYTRQAVINIWTESPHVTDKDTSCLLSLHFIIRRDKLHLIVSMRSSDAWLGFPYDLFDFSMIAAYVTLILRKDLLAFKELKLGSLYFTAGSQHLYEKYYDEAANILKVYKLADSIPVGASFAIDYYEDDEHLKAWLLNMANSGVLENA